MVCKNCGAFLSDDLKDCPVCGAIIGDETESVDNTAVKDTFISPDADEGAVKPKKKKSFVLVGIIKDFGKRCHLLKLSSYSERIVAF